MKTRRTVFVKAYEIVDVILLLICHFTAFFILNPQYSSIKREILLRSIRFAELVPASIILIAWHFILFFFGLYYSKRLLSFAMVCLETVKALLICSVVGYFGLKYFHWPYVSLQYALLFFLLSAGSMISFRAGIRLLLKFVRVRGRNLRQVLIIGTNPRAMKFASHITGNRTLGYQLVGFVDDSWEGSESASQQGYNMVGNLQTAYDYIRDSVVDEVFIGLPLKSYYAWVTAFAKACEKYGIIIRISSDILHTDISTSDVDSFEGMPMVAHYTGAIRERHQVMKRMLDFSVSLVLLSLLAPAMLLIGVLVRATSPGPAFFRQVRIGLNKRRFTIYKFRTMLVDAEAHQQSLESRNESDGAAFKIKDDPRVTPLGRVLRKTSLDELPQLINVLKGSMSLVGPRPLPLRDFARFSQDWHRRRFSVKPGITCLWQVKGRNALPFDQWMRLDMEYIDNWSLRMDFEILFRTAFAVFNKTGA
jgi:exopolysaccharide biosynthesis polyprenyl glycosylphosphotransferase